MTIHVLITGELHRDPIQRTSASGKTFVTANVRSQADGETVWASVICFSEEGMAELLRLKAGDAVSVQGKAKLVVYERNGEHRPSLDVVASSVTALRPKPRTRRPRQDRQDSRGFDPRQVYGRPATAHQAEPEDGFNDPILF